MQFSMLLGTQVVGNYLSNKFTGSLKIIVEDETCTVWLSSGSVTSMRSTKKSESEVIPLLLTTTGGDIELRPETITADRLNYPAELEKLLSERQFDFKSWFLLTPYIHCMNTKIAPPADLNSAENIRLLQKKCDDGADFDQLSAGLNEKDFWNTFILASSIGSISISYHKHLGSLVKRYQDALDAEIKRFMGAAISQSFNRNIDHSIIEWRENFTDASYGTKPFEAWAKAIYIAALDVVPSSISEKMLGKVLSSMPANDQKTLKMLI
jgi:hypothetical protein